MDVTWSNLVWLAGRLHPMLNHVPIGLLVGLALYEFLALWRSNARPAPSVLVWLLGVGTVAAALSGLARRDELGRDDDTMLFHMWLGIALAALCAALPVLHARALLRARWQERALRSAPSVDAAEAINARPMRSLAAAYRGNLFLALIVMAFAGHLGGVITHGPGFVIQPLRVVLGLAKDEASTPADGKTSAPGERQNLPEAADTPAPAAGPGVAETPVTPGAAVTPGVVEGPAGEVGAAEQSVGVVATDLAWKEHPAGKLLIQYCIACHAPTKAKDGVDVSTYASTMAGGDEGAIVLPGNPDRSVLLRLMKRPIDARKRMPPRGEPQPSEAEIAVIEAWIARGAKLVEPEAQQQVVEPVAAEPAPAVTEPESPPAKALPAEEGPAGDVVVNEIANASPLQRGFVIVLESSTGRRTELRSPFDPRELDDEAVLRVLRPLRERVRSVLLPEGKLTFRTLLALSEFPSLERLELHGTWLRDDALLITGNSVKHESDSRTNPASDPTRAQQSTIDGVPFDAGGSRPSPPAPALRWPALRELVISGEGVTDASLPVFARMPELRTLWVGNTRITPAGLASLKLARPDIDQRPLPASPSEPGSR
ncbi:MAG: c-type cytochrome domain-containing protein [Planctomycetota bacterium]|nr:c-type cytochrome domain-containing protein [Planctomycetota bacterium]